MLELGQGHWECLRVGGTHTRDRGGKDRNTCRSTPASRFNPVSVPRVAGGNEGYSLIRMKAIGSLAETC